MMQIVIQSCGVRYTYNINEIWQISLGFCNLIAVILFYYLTQGEPETQDGNTVFCKGCKGMLFTRVL